MLQYSSLSFLVQYLKLVQTIRITIGQLLPTLECRIQYAHVYIVLPYM